MVAFRRPGGGGRCVRGWRGRVHRRGALAGLCLRAPFQGLAAGSFCVRVLGFQTSVTAGLLGLLHMCGRFMAVLRSWLPCACCLSSPSLSWRSPTCGRLRHCKRSCMTQRSCCACTQRVAATGATTELYNIWATMSEHRCGPLSCEPGSLSGRRRLHLLSAPCDL